jgi:ribosome-binding factor A
MLTVTAVEVAPDMRTAVVYMSSLDEATSEVLEEHRGHLQRLIGTQMTIKRTPRLSFRADPAVAAGSRVEELLRGIDQEERDERGGGDSGASGDEGESPAEGR